MRDDADFSAYAVARWPTLVRVLVLLGTPPEVAPGVAQKALGRVRTDWRRRDELGDLDEHTAQTLLECRPADQGGGWEPEPGDGSGPSDAEWPALRARLHRLEPAERAELVLGSLLDIGGRASEVDVDTVRRVADSVVVEPLDLEQVVLAEQDERRARRRRTTRVVASVVAVLAVVAGGWTWWATRPAPPPGLPDAPVEQVDNPVAVGWYTDRTLQLDRVALTIDALHSFAQVPQGAVYADSAGEVILVETDGERTRLGTQAPDGAFAVSDQDALAAWVDVSGAPQLHVYDLAEREQVGTVAVGDSARVVAVDDGVVHVADTDGAYAFEAGDGWIASAQVGPGDVLDAAGDAVAFQDSQRSLLVTRGGSGARLTLAGVGAQLSPEGDYVLTRTGSVGGGVRGPVRLFDTITGQEVDTGLTRDAEVYAAKLGGRGVATYLVELEQDDPDDGPRLSSSGSLQLVTCLLVDPGLSATCTVHRTFPRSTSWALAQ